MKILLTGAAGIVGTALRPHLARLGDQLLLTDLDAITDLQENETFTQADLTASTALDQLVRGVDAIIHMAGLVGPDYQFDQVLETNVVVTHHLLQAAHRHSVRRIVYASSHHAVGFLPRGSTIDHNTPPCPDSWYGLSKATDELQCSHAAHAYNLDILCIRIGNVDATVADERRMHMWSSARDLAALIEIGLRGKQTGFHTVYGVSRCPDPFFDNRHAESLGYTPQDASLEHLADPKITGQRRSPDNPAHKYIGGHFATNALRSEGQS